MNRPNSDRDRERTALQALRKFRVPHTLLTIAIIVSILPGSAMAATSAPATETGTPIAENIDGDVIECPDDRSFNYASIAYEDVDSWDLFINARDYAQKAINKCDLEYRFTIEVAGEIRAHVIGEDAAEPFNPGETIDIADARNDPQAYDFFWLG